MSTGSCLWMTELYVEWHTSGPLGGLSLTLSDLHIFYFLDEMFQEQAGSLKECLLALLAI